MVSWVKYILSEGRQAKIVMMAIIMMMMRERERDQLKERKELVSFSPYPPSTYPFCVILSWLRKSRKMGV